jgi:excisionase family DNA binding protein
MKLLTLPEAAKYLRMSRSSLYQRKDIPRYRRPGSRVVLFDQEELEAWLKGGRMVLEGLYRESPICEGHLARGEDRKEMLEIPSDPVYHRNARYR